MTESLNVVIDSPFPALALEQAQDYYEWLAPAFEARDNQPEPAEWIRLIESGELVFVRVMVDDEVKAVAAAQVHEGLEREVVIGALVGTDIEQWFKPLSETFDKMATELGAKWVVLHGRPAWEKLLKDEGYRPLQVTLRKRIGVTNGQS